jgi:hypothetical protein
MTMRMKVSVVVFMLLLQYILSFPICNVQAEVKALNYEGNHCLSFNESTDDYADCSSDSIFVADNLTIEAWVKPKYYVQAGSNALYGHRWGCIAHRRPGWWFGFNYEDGMLHFIIDSPSSDYSSDRKEWDKNSWYHVAVTYNSTLTSGNIKFYVNGTFDSQHDEHDLIVYSSGPLQIGAQYGGPEGGHQYGGLIDEVRYWDVSRTQAEIQSAWNRTLDNTTETTNPNLIGYWRFDDGSGTTAEDYSIYENKADLLGDPLPQWISPAAPIIPEFSSLSMILILTITIQLTVIFLRRRLRKLHIS